MPVHDPRYPWVLASLCQSDDQTERALAGERPEPLGYKWFVECRVLDAWQQIEIFTEFGQACTFACELVFNDSSIEEVRVCDIDRNVLYSLDRNIRGLS